jgi:hypothetical protein
VKVGRARELSLEVYLGLYRFAPSYDRKTTQTLFQGQAPEKSSGFLGSEADSTGGRGHERTAVHGLCGCIRFELRSAKDRYYLAT